MGTVVGMRTRTLRAALGIAMLVALTGCVDGDPLPTLPPTPTSTPVFASEEEALAAAEAAYEAYNEMSNTIAAEGGRDPERIEPFVTPNYLPSEVDTYDYYRVNGLHLEGGVRVARLSLQQYLELDGSAEVAVYVCLDVLAARVIDNSGVDVTPRDRDDVIPLEVVFVGVSRDELKIDRSDQWSDSSFCS